MRRIKKQSAFTLIELLVVIAIIGILSSVVLVSLNLARSKGADSKVKSQLANSRKSAEIYFNANNFYNDIITVGSNVDSDCTTAGSMFQDVDSGMIQYSDINNYPGGTTMRCSATETEYAISASLSTPGDFWCVDWSGASKLVQAADHATAHPDGDTTCN